jgi:hypothetical protein
MEDDLIRCSVGLIPTGTDDELREKVKSLKIKSNICHYCTNTIPKPFYGKNTRSLFLSMYYPYTELIFRKKYNENEEYLTELRNRLKSHKQEAEDLINEYISAGQDKIYINAVTGSDDLYKNFPENSHQGKIIHNEYVKFIRNQIALDLDKGISKVKPEHRIVFERYNNSENELLGCLKQTQRWAENECRKKFGYPLIGEQWLSETSLFKIVQILFSNYEVIFHYRGGELEGLELDIWLPDLKLGIEYQGEQHYKVVEHWGGEKGLKERIERDKRKKKLMKKAGFALIEFKYDEALTEENVERKLKKYLLAR